MRMKTGLERVLFLGGKTQTIQTFPEMSHVSAMIYDVVYYNRSIVASLMIRCKEEYYSIGRGATA